MRNSPDDSWRIVKTSKQMIKLLLENNVDVISLDHDLGDEINGTGYDVIEWIEMMVYTMEYIPPKIFIHTSNPPARKRMEQALRAIERKVNNDRKNVS